MITVQSSMQAMMKGRHINFKISIKEITITDIKKDKKKKTRRNYWKASIS